MPIYRIRIKPKVPWKKEKEEKTMIYYSYPATFIGSTFPVPAVQVVLVNYYPTLPAGSPTPLHPGGPQPLGYRGTVMYPTIYPTYIQPVPVGNYPVMPLTYVGYQQPVRYVVR
jgi:hypothetical protein